MREFFHEFTRTLHSDDGALPCRLRHLQGPTAHERFEVHRNNRRAALVAALALNHPVTRTLVGAAFFGALALEYVRLHPPHSPALGEYGDGFAAFLATFPPALAVAVLPDMARLEWAWQRAYHAAEARPLQLRALAGVPPESLARLSFRTHPATRCIASPHPVASLWHRHQVDCAPDAYAAHAAECALIVRPHAAVGVIALPAAAHGFVAALLAGATVEAASMHHPAVDPGATLRRMIDAGAFEASPC